MCYARDRTKPPFVATQIVDPSKGKIGGEVASRRWPRNSPDPSSSDAQLIELVSAMLTRLHSPSGALTPHLASPPNPSPSDAREFEKMVQEFEKMVQEMLDSHEDCIALAEAVKAVPELYQPQPSDQVGALPAFRIQAISTDSVVQHVLS
jgi:hypothetical protein